MISWISSVWIKILIFGFKTFVRIASFKWFHEISAIEDGCDNRSCFKGIYPEMLYLLLKKLNFTFIVVHEPNFGSEQEDGSWTGTIGE